MLAAGVRVEAESDFILTGSRGAAPRTSVTWMRGPSGSSLSRTCGRRWQSGDQAGKPAAVSALAPGYKKEPDRSKATFEFTVPSHLSLPA